MPYIFGALAALLSNLFFQLLVGLGISTITYLGLDFLLEDVKTQIIKNISFLDNSLISILGIAKIDDAVTIIFSAFIAKMALQGFVNGQKSSFGIK